ncbi:MAG: aminodeoxychorismate lyase, partial [Burkholderiales bacterium]
TNRNEASRPMILVNGLLSDSLPVTDRGLMYGDGVFRTLSVRSGKPQYLRSHLAKLAWDCAAIQLPALDLELLKVEITSACVDQSNCVLKIVITRGSGGRSYRVPDALVSNRIVMTSPFPRYPAHYGSQGVVARWCNTRLAVPSPTPGVKTLNRLENVLARMEWSDAAIAEGLLCDADDQVIEGTMSNLFYVQAGKLMTPDLSRCGVAGVQRDRIIALATNLSIPFGVKSPHKNDLISSDELFLCNSIIGIWPVTALGEQCWNVGPLTRQFQAELAQSDNDD